VHARTAEAIEEERRLLYVSVTRAREHLLLSRAQGRPRSRFLATLFPSQAAAVKAHP
jgi:DNA helicase-2/ATP-dependent DNA helicase PcrA